MQRFVSRALSVVWNGLRSFHHDTNGSILAYAAVLPVLAGVLAIGVETGELYRTKRQMQSAADDAALAGTIDSLAGATPSTIAADARYEAQRNGFTNGSGTVGVAVNVPPSSGPNVGTANAVEVIVSKTQSLSFAGVLNSWLGHAGNGYTITARSVAARTTTTSTQTTTTTQTTTNSVGCLVALTPNNEQGISMSSFNNYTGDCAIMSNGTATGTGGNASIGISNFNNFTLSGTNGLIWTRGTLSATSYNNMVPAPSAAMTNQSTSIVDPYASLATPSPGTCTYTNYQEPNGNNLTLLPGTYCGGLSVVNKSNIYFTAGTYFISNGDLIIRSDNNVSCSNCTSGAGVTFILTQTSGNNANIGGVSITSENNVTLNAPNSGTYKGVLFYQDRRVAVGTMNSTSKIFALSSLNNATLSGAIYFPNNLISISSINNVGGNNSTGCTVWIGRYLNFTSYNNNYVAGCGAYGTTPAGSTTTTTSPSTNTVTTNKGKVLE
jgi:Flp pilus assembly protein TadG